MFLPGGFLLPPMFPVQLAVVSVSGARNWFISDMYFLNSQNQPHNSASETPAPASQHPILGGMGLGRTEPLPQASRV